jgi:hypothetical protein
MNVKCLSNEDLVRRLQELSFDAGIQFINGERIKATLQTRAEIREELMCRLQNRHLPTTELSTKLVANSSIDL